MKVQNGYKACEPSPSLLIAVIPEENRASIDGHKPMDSILLDVCVECEGKHSCGWSGV
jgi:hypothetical protein